MHAAIALQAELYNRLSSDPTLVGLLDGPNIFDGVPRKQALPYITFGTAIHRQWDTGTESGLEHEVYLVVWTSSVSRKTAFEITDAVIDALGGLPDTVNSHALVNFAHLETEAHQDIKADCFKATLKFRAVTEPL